MFVNVSIHCSSLYKNAHMLSYFVLTWLVYMLSSNWLKCACDMHIYMPSVSKSVVLVYSSTGICVAGICVCTCVQHVHVMCLICVRACMLCACVCLCVCVCVCVWCDGSAQSYDYYCMCI